MSLSGDFITREEWQELLSGYTTAVLVGDWVAAETASAGATAFTVVLDETLATASDTGTAPIVGSADVINFKDARVVFGRGKFESATAKVGLNFGFSTEVSSVATSAGVTTLTLKDTLPNAVAIGDRFTIFRSIATVQATVSENVQEVGGTPVPTVNGVPSVPTFNGLTLANYVASGTAASATTPILANYGNTASHYTVPANGTLNVAIAVGTASAFTISRNAGGSASYNDMNAGNNLNANTEYLFSTPVRDGEVIDFEVGTAATLNALDVFFVPNQ